MHDVVLHVDFLCIGEPINTIYFYVTGQVREVCKGDIARAKSLRGMSANFTWFYPITLGIADISIYICANGLTHDYL